MYLMLIIRFPKWDINAITSQMAHFLCENSGNNHRYHLKNMVLVSQRNAFWGLDLPNLRDFFSLLASWAKIYFVEIELEDSRGS